MFWVYILRCADDSYYTGNLENRIGQHQTGKCGGYTATRRPVELAWSQECVTREEALSAEMQIKGWGRKKKEAMMRGDWAEVSRLAQSKSVHPEPFDTVRPEPPSTQLRTGFDPVRPELVEGTNSAQENLVEGLCGSTGSPRTAKTILSS